jgi:hypothetical protein
MKLYKYMTWQPFDEGCYTKDNLLKSNLYFNSPDKLNDPFDTLPFVNTDVNSKEFINWAIKTVMTKEHVTKQIARKKALDRIKKDPRFKNIHTIREEAQKTISAMRTNTGICCFTTNEPETLLMWAHYGDKHKGICLEFNFSGKKIFKGHATDNRSISKPVQIIYSKTLPIHNFFSDSKYEFDELGKSLLTKSIEWKYENEYRIIFMNYVGIANYEEQILTGVYAGYKMGTNEFNELKKAIKIMRIQPQLYHMEKEDRKFRLKPVEDFQ